MSHDHHYEGKTRSIFFPKKEKKKRKVKDTSKHIK